MTYIPAVQPGRQGRQGEPDGEGPARRRSLLFQGGHGTKAPVDRGMVRLRGPLDVEVDLGQVVGFDHRLISVLQFLHVRDHLRQLLPGRPAERDHDVAPLWRTAETCERMAMSKAPPLMSSVG